MVTKKDLAERYHISHNTVTDTLKACGLDTSKRSYTEEEITERFDVARKLFDAGKTSKEIEAYFSMKDAGKRGGGVPGGASASQGGSSELKLKEQIASEMGQAVQEMVNSAAKEVVSYIPTMAGIAFQSLVENGSVKEAFSEYQEKVAALPPSFGGEPQMGLLQGEVSYEVVSEPPYGEAHKDEEAEGECTEVVDDEMATGE